MPEEKQANKTKVVAQVCEYVYKVLDFLAFQVRHICPINCLSIMTNFSQNYFCMKNTDCGQIVSFL